MIGILIGLAIVFGLILLVLLYWAMLDSIFPEKLRTNEVFQVTTADLWKIRMCRYRKGRTGGQPVLLVHGANTNQHNFTTPEGVSLVDYLVERGYDCWAVDLRGSRSSIAPFERDRSQVTTDDYLNDDIPTAIRFVQQETGYARVHYIGHSMGGMLLYAYALRYGTDSIASGVTLGSPLGFEGVKRRRSTLAISLICLWPSLSGSLVRGCIPFVSFFRLSSELFPTNMRNVAKTMGSAHFYRMIEDPLPGVLQDMCRWMNFPGWRMDHGDLNVLEGLKTLDFPLFALYAPQDPFVSPAAAKAFFEALPTGDKRMLVCSKEHGFKNDYNHCDLAFSHEGAREVFGPIARWLETHSSRERMPVATPEIATGYQAPLGGDERAGILSGDSFAHLARAEAPTPPLADVKAPSPKKKATTRKKSPSKKKPVARKSSKKKAATGKQSADAPTTKQATSGRKAPGREDKGGPDLAAASAALNALRPSARVLPATEAADISIRGRAKQKKKDHSVETPKSVLKALGDASGVLNELKQEDDKK